MAGAKYIPPALRGKAENNDHETPPGQKRYTLDEIAEYFGWPHEPETEKSSEPIIANGQDESETAAVVENSRRERGTLNTTYEEQDTLAYIVLFYRANPFWKEKKEVFCKSNLDLLPDPSTLTPENGEPVREQQSYPVFMQRGRIHGDNNARGMAFDGYYGVAGVRYLEPKTDELTEYLQAKFGDRQRRGEAWERSLSRKWAVVTLRRDEGRKDEEPQIGTPQRGVNDMLAEMRLKS